MPKKDQEAVRLDYIAKVHSALFEVGRREHGVFLTYIILSCIIIFLATGQVSISHQFSMLGFVVSAPQAFLLVAMALAIAALQYYDVALSKYQERLRRVIIQEYQSLDFVPESVPMDSKWSAFVYPNAGTVLNSTFLHDMLYPYIFAPFASTLPTVIKTRKAPRMLVLRMIAGFLASLVVLVGILSLPLAAEFLALRAASNQQGMSWLLAIAILVIAFLNVVALFIGDWPTRASVKQGMGEMLAPHRAAIETALADIQAAQKAQQTAATNGNAEQGGVADERRDARDAVSSDTDEPPDAPKTH